MQEGSREEQLLHFSLQEALPPGDMLVLNSNLGTLSRLGTDAQDRPKILVQRLFHPSEMRVLVPLLEMFPYYCPYEVLHASFYDGQMTEEAIAKSRGLLSQAQQDGEWDKSLRPVRNAISSTRAKLRDFGLGISLIQETGYMLMMLRERNKI